VDFVIDPVANVLRPVSPPVEAESVFDALDIVAFVAASVWPDFVTLSVLLVCKPHALVNRPTLMLELSVSMSLAVHPIAVIDLSRDVRKHTFAVCLAKEPLSIVDCAILEPNLSLSVSESAKPLAFVRCFRHLVSVLAEFKPLFVNKSDVTQLVFLFTQRLVIISVFEVNHLIQFACFVRFAREALVLFNQPPPEKSLQLENVRQKLDLVFFLVEPRLLRFSRTYGHVPVFK